MKIFTLYPWKLMGGKSLLLLFVECNECRMVYVLMLKKKNKTCNFNWLINQTGVFIRKYFGITRIILHLAFEFKLLVQNQWIYNKVQKMVFNSLLSATRNETK